MALTTASVPPKSAAGQIADLEAALPAGATPANEAQIYAARNDVLPGGEPFVIPAVRPAYLTERNRRQRVP